MTLLNTKRLEHRRAVDIRADIAKIDRAGLELKVVEIEQQRRQLLLAGSDDQLHENKRELDDARLQVERADVLLDELSRLASEADAREAAEALEADHAEALKAMAAIDRAIAEAEPIATRLRAKARRSDGGSSGCCQMERQGARRWPTGTPHRAHRTLPREIAVYRNAPGNAMNSILKDWTVPTRREPATRWAWP